MSTPIVPPQLTPAQAMDELRRAFDSLSAVPTPKPLTESTVPAFDVASFDSNFVLEIELLLRPRLGVQFDGAAVFGYTTGAYPPTRTLGEVAALLSTAVTEARGARE